jgi:hypothetical protein
LGDYENIGDIVHVNAEAIALFAYTNNEFINNMNINQLLPLPFK